MLATVAAVPVLLAATPATAQEQVADGVRWSGAWTDVYNSDQVVELDGGPLVAAAPGATVTLRCSL